MARRRFPVMQRIRDIRRKTSAGSLGDDKMMISGDMPHAEARDNWITDIKERGDISEAQKQTSLG